MKRYIEGYVWWKISLLYGACLLIGAVPAFTSARGDSHATAEKTSEQPAVQQVISGVPTHITIPAADINLAIVKGTQDSTAQWTVSDKDANYMDAMAPLRNNGGTMVIYGHDRASIFHNIRALKENDLVLVSTDNGYIFVYVYHNATAYIQPSDTKFLQKFQSKPQLELLTCDGLWSEKRLLMTLSLEKVVKQ
jgi:LPXTG-site transpeptidase (sortase) family protein